MAKRDETVAEREWHELKAELLGRPRESLDLFDIERSIQEHLSAMGRELMTAAMKKADSDAPEVEIDGASWVREASRPARTARCSDGTRSSGVSISRLGGVASRSRWTCASGSSSVRTRRGSRVS